jgi:hypothetical protein
MKAEERDRLAAAIEALDTDFSEDRQLALQDAVEIVRAWPIEDPSCVCTRMDLPLGANEHQHYTLTPPPAGCPAHPYSRYSNPTVRQEVFDDHVVGYQNSGGLVQTA